MGDSRQRLPGFDCQWPGNDDEHEWTPIQALDAEQAAELYAEQTCSRDNECYASFEGNGEDIAVRVNGVTQLFKVTCEFLPHFSGHPKR